jgi:hypothetical protein
VIDELKTLLVSELNLEDITADEIDASAPLFRDTAWGWTRSMRWNWLWC